MTTEVLRGGRILTATGWLDHGWIAVRDGRVEALGDGPPPPGEIIDLGGDPVVPGFVDLHVHGGGGASFQDPTQAQAARDFHLGHGTTTILASLVTAPIDELVAATSGLVPLARAGVIAGIHLEGPFLASSHCGAHDPTLLRDPEPDLLETLLDAGEGAVRVVTIAPERPGAIAAIALLTARGVVAAIGHTGADLARTRTAIDAGARLATHLFNGMPAMGHRDPGPVLALLDDDRVTVELINDGVHLHPDLVAHVLRTKKSSALITDAISATGMGDGEVQLSGLDVRVESGVARLTNGGSLAGSTLTMDAAVRNAVDSGVPLAEAARAASAIPAAVLGLGDRVGTLAPGMDADLVVLDARLGVRRVLAKGRWVR